MKEDNNIQITVTFRHMDSSDHLRTYSQEKIERCLKKYTHKVTDASLVLKVEKRRQIAEISLHSDGAHLKILKKAMICINQLMLW